MKAKTLISLVVGIGFVTLAPITWAAGHGGGGGGGGGFHGGGGGFHGGGLRAGGSAGGVGMRGGGVGLAERASQAALRTLLVQGRGSLQWVIHHPDSLSLMDGLIDPLPLTLPAIAAQWLQQCVLRKQSRNADRTGGSTITLLNVTREIGTAIGTGAMHISITATSLSLPTASGAD